ncbi:RdgB/HAM1 family non-canonical purine NTP pyrophosphatase [Ectothiorhodospiraceae bacterium WFHF3C12]|nr:RdgB/HAM1 family non-canonical purine NTP pyrophosphatase [Ectothiorhodospiraceae bacterium WFHF3C12]
MSQRIVFASNNAGKVREVAAILAGHSWTLVPQSEYAVPSVAETGLSFVENAILKARHACGHTGLPAIADDSGIAVDALDGAPGIYSARFAGEDGDDDANNRRLLDELFDVPEDERGAAFHCVMVAMRHAADPTPLICHGRWDGVIIDAPRGENGFGYDPLFFIPEMGRTSAELDPQTKNELSHRGQALRALAASLDEFMQSPQAHPRAV